MRLAHIKRPRDLAASRGPGAAGIGWFIFSRQSSQFEGDSLLFFWLRSLKEKAFLHSETKAAAHLLPQRQLKHQTKHFYLPLEVSVRSHWRENAHKKAHHLGASF